MDEQPNPNSGSQQSDSGLWCYDTITVVTIVVYEGPAMINTLLCWVLSALIHCDIVISTFGIPVFKDVTSKESRVKMKEVKRVVSSLRLAKRMVTG